MNDMAAPLEYPKISKYLYINQLFKDEDGQSKWVIGDLKSGSQFIISSEKKSQFDTITQCMDGTNSIETIAEKCQMPAEELKKFIQYISQKGLIENVKGTKDERFNEVDRLSLSLLNFEFDQVENPEGASRISNGIWQVLNLILFLNLMYFIYYLSHNSISIPPIRDFLRYGKDQYSGYLGYLMINGGVLLMFIFHEFGHLLAGLKNKIQPERIRFSLYLGFIPMCYVKNKNIYSLQKKEIIQVLLAGIKMNGILMLFCLNMYFFSNIELYKIFFLSNLRIIVLNLSPLTLSDGYFLLSILIGYPNLRQKMYLSLINPEKLKELKSIEVIYILIALLFMLFIVVFEVQWLMGLFITNEVILNVLTILLTIGYFIYLRQVNIKRFKM